MLRLSPTCFRTARKFWRRASRETSAQFELLTVGERSRRGAFTLPIITSARNQQSTAVSSSAASADSGIFWPVADKSVLPTQNLTAGEHKVHRDFGFNLHWFVVQQVGTVAPLPDCINCGAG